MGLFRHVVLAETESVAIGRAERAYRPWLKHMELLWVRNGMKLPLGLPSEIGPLLNAGAAFASTADNFKTFIENQVEATGADYFVCDVAFGDLSVALFRGSQWAPPAHVARIVPYFPTAHPMVGRQNTRRGPGGRSRCSAAFDWSSHRASPESSRARRPPTW
jgi:hypothetical protein